jgi:hypothetical protein
VDGQATQVTGIGPELAIGLIQAALFAVSTFLFRLEPRRSLAVWVLACVVGTVAQALLGPALNRYTPNITIYVSYVSLAVILTWGVGLTAIHAAHLWLARVLGRPPGLGLFTVAFVPIMIVLETVGSNVIRMKLDRYEQYQPLMPALNAMHAPAWLYGFYVVFGLVFYAAARALGLSSSARRPT